MKKVNKSRIITFLILIIIFIIMLVSLRPKEVSETDEELIKCIGEKSILYIQLGCSHCKTQEEMFGNNLKYLNKIDCFYEPEKCINIHGTPAWIINKKQYTGIKTINELKELTKC